MCIWRIWSATAFIQYAFQLLMEAWSSHPVVLYAVRHENSNASFLSDLHVTWCIICWILFIAGIISCQRGSNWFCKLLEEEVEEELHVCEEAGLFCSVLTYICICISYMDSWCLNVNILWCMCRDFDVSSCLRGRCSD